MTICEAQLHLVSHNVKLWWDFGKLKHGKDDNACDLKFTHR